MNKTIFVSHVGLAQTSITVSAESDVGIVERDVNGQVYVGILADERFIPLVLWKHTVGREQLVEAVEAVHNELKAAIAELRPRDVVIDAVSVVAAIWGGRVAYTINDRGGKERYTTYSEAVAQKVRGLIAAQRGSWATVTLFLSNNQVVAAEEFPLFG
jgi:hypothetical protein